MLSRLLRFRNYSTISNFQCNVVILSIGNPLPEYNGTRHSVGHYILEQIRALLNFPAFSKDTVETSRLDSPKLQNANSSKDEHFHNVLLARSTNSYMNLQGRPVLKFWQNYRKKNPNASLVIVHDELQIPLGKIQVRRRNTSARGHNGLRSIDQSMGNEYTKIAVGIGKPEKGSVSDYVLLKFSRSEMEILEETVLPKVMDVVEEMARGKHIKERHQK